MHYLSTRGETGGLGFEAAMLAGLARDGGLYVPEGWPALEAEKLAALAGRPYTDAAFTVLAPYVDDTFTESEFRDMLAGAYATFAHPATVPLVQTGPNDYLLELFHGPTLAFKDVAMQLLARMMDHVLTRSGRRVTIVGATSGDTGASAVEAFRGRAAVDIFILHPKGRVSEVQRRQMTSVDDDNVHNIALEGTFDDCQAVLKALFNDLAFRDRLALAGVNSINWARVVAQSVYYALAAANLGAPGRKVAFSVPTGNFGDVYAGYVAARMGVAIERLIAATNVNDILARTLASGRYEVRGVEATQSPSMDIQVASNFERLLFDLAGRDGGVVRGLMGSLAQSGSFSLDKTMLTGAKAHFSAARADEDETTAAISRMYAETGIVIDPHTAVGVTAARKARDNNDVDADTALVTLATAHPAKFPDAVEKAVGIRPRLPERMGDLYDKKEHVTVLPNDAREVSRFIEQRARAVAGGAA